MNKWEKDEKGNYVQVGNFEVFIDDFDDLKLKGEEIYSQTGSFLDVKTIAEKYDTIFEWIKIFDFNTYIIIAIMIFISVINMSVMLLVLILEKTQINRNFKSIRG